MATQSFYEMLVIDTREKAIQFELAYQDSKERIEPIKSTIFDDLRRSREKLRNKPGNKA